MRSENKSSVYVMLAPGFEEVDVSTVACSLRRAGFSVTVVGLTAGLVRGAYGLSLAADRTLSEVELESPQAIVLPGGGRASCQLSADPRLHHLLRRVVGQGGYVVALESAHRVLRSAGVLPTSRSGSDTGCVGGPGDASAGARPGETLPQNLGRAVVDGQVVLGQDPGAAQEAALTLAWLLEQRPPGLQKDC